MTAEGSPVAAEGSAVTTGRRIVWHGAGLVLAALIAWLVMMSYRQPELLLDLANLRLC